MSSSKLKDKTVSGMSWSAVDSISSQGITFIVGLVLANLLSPAEYGLIGIITIFISISNTIVDSGFSNSLIRKQTVTDEDYSTTFTFNLVLSVIMYIILYLSSPSISLFFHHAQLVPTTRVLGIVIIINSIAIVQRTKLIKNIDFKRQAKISFISSIISGIIGILLAFLGFGVWALVAQQISRQSTNTIGLWVSAHWTPSLSFSKKSFNYQFSFGWKLLLSQIISTIWTEANSLIIGRCYSSATLGQYSRANQFSSLFSNNLTSIIQRVSFPVLSSMKNDEKRLKANYKKMIKVTMFISFIGMLTLAACSRPLIFVLIGEKWEDATKYLPILCFQFLLYPVRAINMNMLQVVGRTDQLLMLEIIKRTLALIPLSLGIFVSIYWMMWGSVVNGIIGYILNSYYSTLEQFMDILPSLIFGSVVALMMYSINFIGLSYLTTLFLQITVGIILIIVLGQVIKIEEYMELKQIVVSTVSKHCHRK